jgi:hypothetical protein
MERLLAKMDANQVEIKTNQERLARMEAKTDVNLKEMKEEMIASLEVMMQVNYEKMMAKLDAHRAAP